MPNETYINLTQLSLALSGLPEMISEAKKRYHSSVLPAYRKKDT